MRSENRRGVCLAAPHSIDANSQTKSPASDPLQSGEYRKLHDCSRSIRRTAEGATATPKSVVARTWTSFGFFQFPVVAHSAKNCDERGNDYSDNAQAKSEKWHIVSLISLRTETSELTKRRTAADRRTLRGCRS